jgi:hypothetical protein
LLVDLADLGAAERRATFGGLDLHIRVRRYPRSVKALTLAMDATVEIDPGATTPLMVRATQVDGHIAWSSPIYVG